MKAQDSDIKYLKTLKIVKDVETDEYVVSYQGDATIDQKVVVKIYLTLIKEGNDFKINGVR